MAPNYIWFSAYEPQILKLLQQFGSLWYLQEDMDIKNVKFVVTLKNFTQ